MAKTSKRNPDWTRDELILALDLYFRVDPSHVSKTHPEIIALSKLLNDLPVDRGMMADEHFRNPNGVYMKLCNFLRLDPSYTGKGLVAGSHLDETIWDEFAANRELLTKTSAAIRRTYHDERAAAFRTSTIDEPEEEFREGKILTRLHKVRERNPHLVQRKKEAIRAKTGTLCCEVCDFNFAEVYGVLGEGFAECHHIRPLSELTTSKTTRLDELAIVCANCHRMLHRPPNYAVEQLRQIVFAMK